MPKSPSKRKSAPSKICDYCGLSFASRGFTTHQKKCIPLHETNKSDIEYEKVLARQAKRRGGDIAGRSSSRSAGLARDGLGVVYNEAARVEASAVASDTHEPHSPTHSLGIEDPDDPEAPQFKLDDIRVEYHPNSGRPSTLHHFEDFKRHQQASSSTLPERKPWRPFESRIDFEFAEIALEAALTKKQADTLIQLMHRCASGKESFTLANHASMCEVWESASTKLTPFETEVITVPYQKEEMLFDFHYRPIWDWVLDLLGDPHLAPHFVWDAQRLFKFDGTSFVRFYDEPWTGDRFWEIQSLLPPGSKPVCIIVYADKTKLSSSGTETGYPVIARCANLLVDIRNGEGVGGGRVVGWLPMVPEDKAKSGKKDYVNFKRVVWHKAFYQLLESIRAHSKTGFWFDCADLVRRLLFPLILILSADYEEQCIMSLIRGFGGKCPCPICLVPADQLSDLSRRHPLRTTSTMQQVLANARKLKSEAKEELLKRFGLRDVDNIFWTIHNSDPYRALSWDRLHAYHGGLYSDHLWPQVQKHVIKLGRDAIKRVDNQMALLPRWRGLNHFDQVMSVSFTDGTKYKDMAKLVLFALHNVLTLRSDSQGYMLLRCLRSYLELDMYAAMEVHTSETIAAGRSELLKFSSLIKEYKEGTKDPDFAKNWNFPKNHTHQHMFDDIEAKGVTRNYSTKPNEKLHGPLKKAYLQTNRKDVAGQILRIDHWHLVSAFIRDGLDERDEFLREEAGENSQEDEGKNVLEYGHTLLGAYVGEVSFQALEEFHSHDIAFKDFRTKLANFLSDSLQANGIPLPDDKWLKFQPSHVITEYRFLKVKYESMVDW